MYIRDLEQALYKHLKNKEIIILYGARQTGKTTLLTHIFSDSSDALILNCERPEIKNILESMNLNRNF